MTLFWRHWPDCPFPVYLGANHLDYPDPRVTTIKADHGNNWTNRVREQITALNTPYVLLFLEDFFMRRPVDTSAVLTSLHSLQALQGDMLRLTPRPTPDIAMPGVPAIGLIKPGAPYRVSTQPAIWRREVLLGLMREGESIWQFEIEGSRRSTDFGKGFYCTWRAVLPYDHHVVERGKWFRHEARRFAKMDIGCDFSRRPIMSYRETLRWFLTVTRFQLLQLIPWEQRMPLVQFARRLGL